MQAATNEPAKQEPAKQEPTKYEPAKQGLLSRHALLAAPQPCALAAACWSQCLACTGAHLHAALPGQLLEDGALATTKARFASKLAHVQSPDTNLMCEQWEQCGGKNGGATCHTCPNNFECTAINEWYYQCQPQDDDKAPKSPHMPPEAPRSPDAKPPMAPKSPDAKPPKSPSPPAGGKVRNSLFIAQHACLLCTAQRIRIRRNGAWSSA